MTYFYCFIELGMEYQRQIGGYALLILQHKPSFASLIKKAVNPLGCRVFVANDGKDLVELYSSSIYNPFGIFGQTGFNCILLDFLHGPAKSGKAFSDIRRLFPSLPPVIGIFSNEGAARVSKLRKPSIDDVLYLPDSIQNINANLKKYIYPINGVLNQTVAKFRENIETEKLPVINPRTLAVLQQMAAQQNFPIQALMESFIDEMGGFISGLLQNFEQEKTRECIKSLTSVKSLCKTLGASQVAFLSEYLEKAIIENNWSFSREILQEFIDRFFILRDFIETYKGTSTAAKQEIL